MGSVGRNIFSVLSAREGGQWTAREYGGGVWGNLHSMPRAKISSDRIFFTRRTGLLRDMTPSGESRLDPRTWSVQQSPRALRLASVAGMGAIVALSVCRSSRIDSWHRQSCVPSLATARLSSLMTAAELEAVAAVLSQLPSVGDAVLGAGMRK